MAGRGSASKSKLRRRLDRRGHCGNWTALCRPPSLLPQGAAPNAVPRRLRLAHCGKRLSPRLARRSLHRCRGWERSDRLLRGGKRGPRMPPPGRAAAPTATGQGPYPPPEGGSMPAWTGGWPTAWRTVARCESGSRGDRPVGGTCGPKSIAGGAPRASQRVDPSRCLRTHRGAVHASALPPRP